MKSKSARTTIASKIQQSRREKLECEKLTGEIRSLGINNQISQLELEASRKEKSDWLSRVSSLSSVGTFVVALAAAGTLILNLLINEQAKKKDDDKRFNSLITGLSDDRTVIKIASLAGLKKRLISGNETAITAVAYAGTSESQSHLRNFFLEAIKLQPNKAIEILEAVSKSANAEATDFMASWGLARREYNRLTDDQKKTLGTQIRADIRRFLAGSKLNQRIFVNSKIFLYSLGKSSELKFDHGNLRWYSFLGESIDLKTASFRNANLFRTDFYGVDLRGARFNKARIVLTDFKYTNLGGADFSGARFSKKKPDQVERDGAKDRTHTLFEHSDLAGVIFENSCLDNANFSGAKNLNYESLKNAKFGRALFDNTQTIELKKLGLPKLGNEEC